MVVVVGAQKVPFQAVFGPHPPTGILGAVGAVEVFTPAPFPCPHSIAVTRKVPSVHLIVAVCVVVVTVGAGPPFFSQLDCVEPSLHRTAWALGATKSIRPVDMIESARSSDEAALKRFITSSKAGLLGKRLLPFFPALAGAK